MGKISDFLSGIKILEEVESPLNGKITVIKSLAFGTYIQVGGLTQSGGIVTGIWKKVLRKLSPHSTKQSLDNSVGKALRGEDVDNELKVLILGLGGGGIVSVVKKYWKSAQITGVDIDPVMVKLGKKYLGLEEISRAWPGSIRVEIGDAMKSIQSKIMSKKKYDMILVDIYHGDTYPEKFEKEDFLKHIVRLLTVNGVVVFNRLYYGEKRSQSVKFGNMLERIFKKVDWVYPEANVMFVCFK